MSEQLAGQDGSSGPAGDGDLKRHIGLVGLLFASVGSIIGSGWLFGAFNASIIAGPAAIISWALGGAMVILIGLTYAELGTMFPLSGGVVRFPRFAFGGFAAFMIGWITWLSAASVAPVEVEAALQYASNNIGGLTHVPAGSGGNPVLTFPVGYIVAVILLAIFCWINLIGIRWFARVNNAIVSWKLVVIILVVVAFLLTKFQSGNFSNFGGFAPYGAHGVFEAIATAGITFSFLGFRQGIELAGETDNPKRNVPIAVIGSVAICGVIYILLQVAFIGAAPSGQLGKGWADLSFTNDFGPLAGIAQIIGLSWLASVLYVDAVISPADTGLIYTTATARISYAMGRSGTAPEKVAETTEKGAPWVSLLLAFIVGLIFFLPFPGWQKLVTFITSATVLSFGTGPLVWAAMRGSIPDYQRSFRLPGGHAIPMLAFYSANMIVFWAGWNTNWKLFVAILLGLALLPVFKRVGGGQKLNLNMRHGWWMFPWLGTLALISYLGPYGSQAAKTLELGLGAAIILALSVVIYLLAYRSRMPGSEVEKLINAEPGVPNA